MSELERFYNHERPHQGLEDKTINSDFDESKMDSRDRLLESGSHWNLSRGGDLLGSRTNCLASNCEFVEPS